MKVKKPLNQFTVIDVKNKKQNECKLYENNDTKNIFKVQKSSLKPRFPYRRQKLDLKIVEEEQ